MPAETDKFVIATFALWAGDFAYAEGLLRETALPRLRSAAYERAESPEDIVRTTAAIRLRQLRRRRGEFRQLATDDPRLVDQPLLIEGRHMRGTVWRVSARNFEMRAYLTDLLWERELFDRARAESVKRE